MMLPPPTTTASSAPLVASFTSEAMYASSSASIPKFPGLENDSPLSFRRIRLYLPGMDFLSDCGVAAVPVLEGVVGPVEAGAGGALGMEVLNGAGCTQV